MYHYYRLVETSAVYVSCSLVSIDEAAALVKEPASTRLRNKLHLPIQEIVM